jgi:hypothetical protein
MNWTGGSLQRHSKANANPVVKRQKEHFAKARLRSRPLQTQANTPGLPACRSTAPFVIQLRQSTSEPSIDANSRHPNYVHDSQPPPKASLTGTRSPGASPDGALQDPSLDHDV